MFRLMRNIHLGLGLGFFVMALMFALSSLFVIYRPWLPDEVTENDRTVQLAADAAATPRSVALELIREHGVKGDLSQIEESPETFSLRLYRPGTEHRIEYVRSTGEAKIHDREWQMGQTLLQIHTTHAFWHDFAPSQVWAALSLLSSIGLLLLGVSGIYLWFSHHQERVIGSILLTLGLGYGLITLVLTRMDS